MGPAAPCVLVLRVHPPCLPAVPHFLASSRAPLLRRQAREAMHMSEITICMGMTEMSPVAFQSHTDGEAGLYVGSGSGSSSGRRSA